MYTHSKHSIDMDFIYLFNYLAHHFGNATLHACSSNGIGSPNVGTCGLILSLRFFVVVVVVVVWTVILSLSLYIYIYIYINVYKCIYRMTPLYCRSLSQSLRSSKYTSMYLYNHIHICQSIN